MRHSTKSLNRLQYQIVVVEGGMMNASERQKSKVITSLSFSSNNNRKRKHNDMNNSAKGHS